MLKELKKLTCICCGGELAEKEGKLVCKYCKSTFEEVEKISEEEVIALNRATTDRNLLRFDEALEEYTLLLKKYPENEAGNWGALLCDYGIIYEQDYNGEYIPTCHRLNERPVLESPYYAKLSAEHKENAEKIEKLRLSIMQKAKKIQPYDVFICYKATEEKHGVSVPTKESKWARDIYELLTKKGLRVFFAEKSLAGSNIEYEPHIYAALRSAKLMFVLAGSIEHVNSTWVANEWKRYAKYIRDGEEKTLRVVYDNIEPYNLPKELQVTQAIDHNDMGWDKAVEKAADDIFAPSLEEDKQKETETNSSAGTGKKENKISNKGIFAIAAAAVATLGIVGGVLFYKNNTESVENPETSYSTVVEPEEDSTEKTPNANENSIYIVENNAIVGLTDAGLNASILKIPAEIDGIEIKEIGAEAFAYATNLTTVVIPNGITKVGDLAFKNCAKLERVTIPDGIAEYGEDIFYGCEALKTAEIAANAAFVLPRTIESVVVISGEYLSGFEHCTKLSSIVLPDSLVEIGQGCFYECAGLNNIEIPNSVTNIGAYAFRACNGLNDIIIPNGVTTIREHAFAFCDNLESITIGDNVTTIEKRVFWTCKNLSSVKWGNKIESIGEYAFGGCEKLTNITIPDSVTNIGYSAFPVRVMELNENGGLKYLGSNSNPYFYLVDADGNLTTAKIPASCKFIELQAFMWCDSLTSISVEENNEKYKSVEGVLYSKDGKILIQYPQAKEENSLVLPDGLEKIESCAFQDCVGLTSVTFSNSVTSIDSSAFRGCINLQEIVIEKTLTIIDELAFADCSSLTSIIFNGTTEEWDKVVKGSYWNDNVPATEVICTDGTVAI